MRNLRPNARGQAMVLFALTGLLVTLMVCVTLSIGMRAREKIELQTAADAAAYSNAVITARSFNQIAILNRTQVSLYVAQAAVESLISYSSTARAAMRAAKYALDTLNARVQAQQQQDASACIAQLSDLPPNLRHELFVMLRMVRLDAASNAEVQQAMQDFLTQVMDPSNFDQSNPNSMSMCIFARSIQMAPACNCLVAIGPWEAAAAAKAIDDEVTRIQPIWDQYDDRAGPQAYRIQDAIVSAWNAEKSVFDWSQGAVGSGGVPQQIADEARRGSPWHGNGAELFSSGAANGINTREILKAGSGNSMASLYAAMGSRGSQFIRDRSGQYGIIQSKIQSLINDGTVSTRNVDRITPVPAGTFHVKVDGTGAGYWASSRDSKAPSGVFAWGADDFTVTIHTNPPPPVCSPPLPQWNSCAPVRSDYPWSGNSQVRTTDLTDTTDAHTWSPMGAGDANPAEIYHTVGPCTPLPPLYNNCPAVWVMFLDYGPDGAADAYGQPKNYAVMERDYDVARGAHPDPWNLLVNFRLSPSGSGGHFDINSGSYNKQVAIGAGLAYYHRYGHWDEPPNFFNPFWRATLARTDIDAESAGDLGSVLTQVGLGSGGYQGFH